MKHLKLLFYERCKMTKELNFFFLLPRLCVYTIQSRFVLLFFSYCTIVLEAIEQSKMLILVGRTA